MNNRLTLIQRAALLVLLSTLGPQLSTVFAQGSSIGSFTYQGRLNDTNGPANGLYDFSFALFTASTGGSQISTTVTRTFLPVTNGLFIIPLDFPGASNFPGADRWLEIAVHPSGVGTNITLSPRQQITAAPYAITAGNVISGGLASGTYGNAVTLNNANNNFSGAFTGNGAGVTNVNAVTLNGISSSGFWKTNGNAGANPTNGAFLGTTDNLPLELRVNGARALRLEPTVDSTEVNVIGGSVGNLVANGTYGATVWGGGFDGTNNNGNTVGGNFGTVSGGRQNSANNAETTVAGGRANAANGSNSTVSGGYANLVSGGYGSIAGGEFNLLTDSDYGAIGGGFQNTIQSNSIYATISGGGANIILPNSPRGTVSGGIQNTVGAQEGTVAGGAFNSALAFSSTIGGGGNNKASGEWSTIAGGRDGMLTNANYATIGGGWLNTIQTNSDFATIGGGGGNVIQTSGYFATIPGGRYNSATDYAFAAGNRAKANNPGTFVWADSTDVDFASTADNQFLIRAGAGVGINKNNPATALDVNGTVTATGFSGTGSGLTALNASQLTSGTVPAAALGNAWQIGGNGGTTPGTHFLGTTDDQALELKANGARALRLEPNLTSPNLVGGSPVNVVTNGYYGSVIAGGGSSGTPNRVGGYYASVLGGNGNTASGSYSVAMGLNTSARGLYSTAMGRGTVAANDDATAMGLGCSALGWDTVAMGTFSVAGGHYSLAAGYYSQATNQSAFVWSDSSTNPGANSLADNSVTMRASGGYRLFSNPGSTAGASLAAGGTAWAVISDRNVKKDFAAVDSVQILEKLAAMPITQWHYQWETSEVTPHIGPMAQDFKAAFYPGTDDKSITTQESDGVALAAIQGLNQKLEEQRAENAELKKRLERLEQLMNQKMSD